MPGTVTHEVLCFPHMWDTFSLFSWVLILKSCTALLFFFSCGCKNLCLQPGNGLLQKVTTDVGPGWVSSWLVSVNLEDFRDLWHKWHPSPPVIALLSCHCYVSTLTLQINNHQLFLPHAAILAGRFLLFCPRFAILNFETMNLFGSWLKYEITHF